MTNNFVFFSRWAIQRSYFGIPMLYQLSGVHSGVANFIYARQGYFPTRLNDSFGQVPRDNLFGCFFLAFNNLIDDINRICGHFEYDRVIF